MLFCPGHKFKTGLNNLKMVKTQVKTMSTQKLRIVTLKKCNQI